MSLRITFSGDSVKYLHWDVVTIDETSLTGTGTFSTFENIQYGHPARYGWSVLYVLGVVGTQPTPEMGTLPNTFDVSGPGTRADYPPQFVVRALAEEMSYIEDNPELKAQLFEELGLT